MSGEPFRPGDLVEFYDSKNIWLILSGETQASTTQIVSHYCLLIMAPKPTGTWYGFEGRIENIGFLSSGEARLICRP